jgi:cation transport protein ChaC
MDLTPELVALCHREVARGDGEPGRRAATAVQLEAETDRLVAERPGGPLRVFGSGSLLWNPGFPVESWERGLLIGFHRRFTMDMQDFRATPEASGLMMALARGGRCTGMLARVAEGDEAEVIANLVRREMFFAETLGNSRWLTVRTEAGPVRALVFFAGFKAPFILPDLTLHETARRIARACSHGGSNAEYLYNTVVKLEEHGLHDRNLWTLQKLVAAEIRARAEEEVPVQA